MDDKALLRLNKALADAGVCSRRQADALITAGRVTVDGAVVTELGNKIDPARNRLAVDGRPVRLSGAADAPLTLLLNKRPGCVTTANDPEGRPTVFDELPAAYRARRLFPVGRLDYFSEGLLLLTTDGELANRLAHPRWHVDKRYLVTVRGTVNGQTLDTMAKGMTLAEGEQLAPVRARITARLAADRFVLEMELSQGVNRQIRRMCRDLDLTVLKLCRIAQGPVSLGGLPAGKCRELAASELAALRRSVGLPSSAAPAKPSVKAPGKAPRKASESPSGKAPGRRR
ncbi:pseudouridine synthase Rsu [Solidesulfovibrio carbinoliphilus subsp. oakridgensis]|uniref:Pseudouridine synthase n=1 Tax=Solidesulfovibrio carbinoliphilus subsp. oakridgensis TaxID=694327 RepID=G7Q5W5_9BACT|nr:pseudouridine synthase [Solidesulfovibrio carbinoliphilus]EHJ46902.1 pseudouridine synthase Rsu [Solidesulfovibrio carbinoliphilus subsp. oakridgensis]